MNSTVSFDAVGRLSGYTHAYPGGTNNLTVGLTLGPNSQIDSRTASNNAYD